MIMHSWVGTGRFTLTTPATVNFYDPLDRVISHLRVEDEAARRGISLRTGLDQKLCGILNTIEHGLKM
jgi:hypothetical protein